MRVANIAVLAIGGKLVVNIAVASIRASAKYTPYIAHFIFYPSFLPYILLTWGDTRIVASRGPLLELDDSRLNDQLANC